MADIPDIIILTPEERAAEKAAKEPVCLGEIPDRNVIRLDICPREEMEKEDFLVFADQQTAVMWTSLRAKELSCEGVELFSPRLNEIIQALPDERVSRSLEYYRRRVEAMMLKW